MKTKEISYYGGMPRTIARISHTNYRTLVRYTVRTWAAWPQDHEATFWEYVGNLPWTLASEADCIREETTTEAWFRLRGCGYKPAQIAAFEEGEPL